MADRNSTAIREYGFGCPSGGHVHICEGAKVEFIGCCASDSYTGGEGVCPDDHLRPMSLLVSPPNSFQLYRRDPLTLISQGIP
ncbi:hypothetical protein V2G26_001578 [Clonostachys chloroleuca]